MTGCGGRTDGYCVHDLCRKHIGVILEKWRLCIVAGLGVADCGQLEILTGLYCGDMLVAGNLLIAVDADADRGRHLSLVTMMLLPMAGTNELACVLTCCVRGPGLGRAAV